MKKIKLLIFSIYCFHLNANDTTRFEPNPLKLSGYIETYYCYDFEQAANHTRPSYFCSFNRHNEFTLNLGFVKANYSTKNVRGNFALMAGTYSEANLASEPGVLKNIFEANVGIKLSEKRNFWLDMGIMPSHIGFESAIGKNCWNLTRSLLADNSPYFESGIKMVYNSKDDNLQLSFFILNGWQRIQRIPNNQTPAFGTQFMYTTKAKNILNWSTYLGNEQNDSFKKWRFFNNFYGQWQIKKRLGLIAGFDIGMQQGRDTLHRRNGTDIWYSPVLILRYQLNSKLKIAGRIEYYSDPNKVMIKLGNNNGFNTFGYSLNLDYNINEFTVWRIEGRALVSDVDDKILKLNQQFSKYNLFTTTSLAVSF